MADRTESRTTESHAFASANIYDVIERRRDVRSEFTGEQVDDAVLLRVLAAAHCAPSVGMSQPWDFILVNDVATRRAFREHVSQQRAAFDARLSGERQRTFRGIRVEGIVRSSLGIVVTYDRERAGPDVLGRHSIPDAGLYSTCLAIQNLWLAATAEHLGVGWVSFYEEPFLMSLLGIPAGVRPVAWLCVGPVTHLEREPDLERLGWRGRRPLADAIHRERYQPR